MKLRSLFAPDLAIALAVFVGTFLLGGAFPTVSGQAQAVFLVEAALGVGILAVVLGSLTVFSTFVTQEYLVVLERSPGGTPGAFFPYKLIAAVSCATILVGLASALVWPLLNENMTLQVVVLAMMNALTVWCVWGMTELVFITARHGELRSRLEMILHEKREEANKKRRVG